MQIELVCRLKHPDLLWFVWLTSKLVSCPTATLFSQFHAANSLVVLITCHTGRENGIDFPTLLNLYFFYTTALEKRDRLGWLVKGYIDMF